MQNCILVSTWVDKVLVINVYIFHDITWHKGVLNVYIFHNIALGRHKEGFLTTPATLTKFYH